MAPICGHTEANANALFAVFGELFLGARPYPVKRCGERGKQQQRERVESEGNSARRRRGGARLCLSRCEADACKRKVGAAQPRMGGSHAS